MNKKPIRRQQTPPAAKSQIEAQVIREKIKTLETQRDTFVAQANQQVAHMNGAIEALEALLPENQVEEAPEAAPKEKAPAGSDQPTDA